MNTKDEIIESMISLFAEKGYSVSMSDLAKSVGIKVPSLYSHFSSKDDIVYEAAKTFFNREHQFYLSHVKNIDLEDTEKSLKFIYNLLISHIKKEENSSFSRNIRLIPDEELKHKCEELLRINGRELIDQIKPIIEEGINQKVLRDDFEGIKLLYLSVIQGILIGILTSKDDILADDKAHKIIWRTFWNGIKYK